MRSLFLLIVFFSSLQYYESFSNSKEDSARYYFQTAKDSLLFSYFAGKRNLDRSMDFVGLLENDSLEASIFQFYGTLEWAHANYPKARTLLRKSIEINAESATAANAFNTLGLSYYYTAAYYEAIHYLTEALTVFQALQDSSGMSRVFNNLGLIYKATGDFDRATDYVVQGIEYKVRYIGLADHYYSSTKSFEVHKNKWISNGLLAENLQILDEKKDSVEVSRAYQKIGVLFLMYDELDSSLYYLEKAYALNKQMGFRPRLALDCVDLGNVYRKFGEIEKAEGYFVEAIGILREERMYPTLGSAIHQLGKLLVDEGRIVEGIELHTLDRKLNDSLNHKTSVARSHLAIAEAFQKIGDISAAIREAKLALQIAEEVGSFGWIMNSNELLARLYTEAGNFKAALSHQNAFHDSKTKELDAANSRVEKEFIANYELDKKAAEIARLASEEELQKQQLVRQQRWLISAGVFSILLFATLVVLWKQQKQVKLLNKRLSTKSEQNENLLKEVHHRVKNNLQMVTSLLAMQGRRTSSEDLQSLFKTTQNRIQSISLTHDHLYKNNTFDKVDLGLFIPDLATMIIQSYESKQAPRVDYQVESAEVKTDTSTIIGLIVHELINNSFKYAFDGTENPVIQIKCKVEHGKLQLDFSDNGKGLGPEGIKKGFGWQIIEACLAGVNGSYSITSEDGFAVEMIMEIH